MKDISNRIISFTNVNRLVFGEGCLAEFRSDFARSGKRKLFLLTIPSLLVELGETIVFFNQHGIEVLIDHQLASEPSFADLDLLLDKVRAFGTDSVAGIGGGSVMDTAKMLAAMIDCNEDARSFAGIGLLKGRNTYLACLPTTAGTGSEVSPNAIFLDEADHSKKGVISPWLVPDAAYVDPLLTIGVPPSVTAATGIDAFTHCLEAYVNNFSHPATDLFALEGMRLIAENLEAAVSDGKNSGARSAIALGSLYGGMCLGPVNTGAIHALAYPLGSRYKIAHGLSNALMMPHVVDFNYGVAPEKYSRVARLFNEKGHSGSLALMLSEWVAACGLPSSLDALGISPNEIDVMANDALKVQRLLKNNVREVTYNDALMIYRNAFGK